MRMRLGLVLQDALGSQDHFHFRRPDTESDGTHGTVGGRVGVHRKQWSCRVVSVRFPGPTTWITPFLGCPRPKSVTPNSWHFSGECFHLVAGNDIGDGEFLIEGGDVVVRHAKGIGRPQHGEFPVSQSLKKLEDWSLRAIMPVNVQFVWDRFPPW
jgi:hypothetical protein